jgi:hypothetical protein
VSDCAAETTEKAENTERTTHGDTQTQRNFEQEIKRPGVVMVFKKKPPELLTS